jgi:probable HAF family extracellular repeat protein
VVGWSFTTAGEAPHALLHAGGVMHDLNRLIPAASGWVLNVAHAINDGGQIVGSGVFRGKRRAFLLTPSVRPTPPTDLLVRQEQGESRSE